MTGIAWVTAMTPDTVVSNIGREVRRVSGGYIRLRPIISYCF